MTLNQFSYDVGLFRIRGGAKGVQGHAVYDQGFALDNPVKENARCFAKGLEQFVTLEMYWVNAEGGKHTGSQFCGGSHVGFLLGKVGKLTRDVPLKATMVLF